MCQKVRLSGARFHNNNQQLLLLLLLLLREEEEEVGPNNRQTTAIISMSKLFVDIIMLCIAGKVWGVCGHAIIYYHPSLTNHYIVSTSHPVSCRRYHDMYCVMMDGGGGGWPIIFLGSWHDTLGGWEEGGCVEVHWIIILYYGVAL